MICRSLAWPQTDESGNVNVSKFGTRVAGCGGFINISQAAKKLVFAGTFTAGGLQIKVENGKLHIIQEGKAKKFISKVQQITFSGSYAAKVQQPVVYVTERAVFELLNGKMTLTEIAPGIDLQTEILDQMDFKPVISPNLKEMDAAMFQENWGMLKSIIADKNRVLQEV